MVRGLWLDLLAFLIDGHEVYGRPLDGLSCSTNAIESFHNKFYLFLKGGGDQILKAGLNFKKKNFD